MPRISDFHPSSVEHAAHIRYALAEISQLAALLSITPQQLISVMDSGLRTSDLIEIVAAKLAVAVGSAAV